MVNPNIPSQRGVVICIVDGVSKSSPLKTPSRTLSANVLGKGRAPGGEGPRPFTSKMTDRWSDPDSNDFILTKKPTSWSLGRRDASLFLTCVVRHRGLSPS